MRKIPQLVLSTSLLALMFSACQETSTPSSPPTEQTEESVAEPSQETEETMEAAVVLNANLATDEELTEIGLSADLVQKIIEARPFLSMTEFVEILGDANQEELYFKVFVPMNLNTTDEADFKLIPGVGDRMAHEFEEYRPYTSIQQFRKEIGKYVDEDEVARYESYVFVPVELNSASEADIMALPGVGHRMAHEFEEYRPYTTMEQFRKEIGKYVDDKELNRLERFVYLNK